MTSENEYSRFAVASLNSTGTATDLSGKVSPLILVEAWLDLAEQTTQAVDHEADEAHSLMEQPLKRVSFQGPWGDGTFVEKAESFDHQVKHIAIQNWGSYQHCTLENRKGCMAMTRTIWMAVGIFLWTLEELLGSHRRLLC
jgi:hypothetical protein